MIIIIIVIKANGKKDYHFFLNCIIVASKRYKSISQLLCHRDLNERGDTKACNPRAFFKKITINELSLLIRSPQAIF